MPYHPCNGLLIIQASIVLNRQVKATGPSSKVRERSQVWARLSSHNRQHKMNG